MKDLQNKKILLFTSKFFGYEEMIKAAMEEEGAIVHLYDERNNPTEIEKILLRKVHFLMIRKINKYYKMIVDKEIIFNPDYIIFVSPEAVTNSALRYIRKKFSKSIIILYMWDSIENKNIKNILCYFDECFSFDLSDCEKYNMKFRPLFYSKEYCIKHEVKDYKYDLCFIGTIHSDRAKILWELKKYCDKNDISYYFYLYIPGSFLLLLRKLFTYSLRLWDKEYIHTKPMEKEKVAMISADTRCVIDINHPKQTGLTMRTIEMLGLKRKIMTTNENVKNYDFYRTENQIIIRRNNINIDKRALYHSYVDVSDEIYKKYSLEVWIKDIFSIR